MEQTKKLTEVDVLNAIMQCVRENIVVTTIPETDNSFVIRCVNGQTFQVLIQAR